MNRALAPEVDLPTRSTASPAVELPSPPVTLGASALDDSNRETNLPNVPIAESGPQIVPPPTPPIPSSVASSGPGTDDAIDPIRASVVQSLTTGGHSTAAILLEDGKWTLEPSQVRIEVGAKATMIRITFNAQAEKLIRAGLTQAGAPSRFLIVPGEASTASSSPVKRAAPQGSIEAEARNNPLVLQAQSIFNAEIVTVVDLRT